MILSPSYKRISELGRLVEESSKKNKLEILNEWFELVERAGLDKLSPKVIDELISQSIR